MHTVPAAGMRTCAFTHATLLSTKPTSMRQFWPTRQRDMTKNRKPATKNSSNDRRD